MFQLRQPQILRPLASRLTYSTFRRILVTSSIFSTFVLILAIEQTLYVQLAETMGMSAVLWFLFHAAVIIAAFLVAPLFGRPGVSGAVRVALAILLIPVIAGFALGGCVFALSAPDNPLITASPVQTALSFPLYGAALGPLLLFGVIQEAPLVAVLVLLGAAVPHLAIRRFAALDTPPPTEPLAAPAQKAKKPRPRARRTGNKR